MADEDEARIGFTIVSSRPTIGMGFLIEPLSIALPIGAFNGSLIVENNQVIGSRLVAQPFAQVQYFHPRPSAANYDPMAMAGSNMARTNPELQKAIEERLNRIAAKEQIEKSKIPADLVTASGSGIDPEISVQSAMIQVKRIAHARHMPEQNIEKLIQSHTVQPIFGILGQARINVLELNLALDRGGK